MKTNQSDVYDYSTGAVNTYEAVPPTTTLAKPPFAAVSANLLNETFEERLCRLGKIRCPHERNSSRPPSSGSASPTAHPPESRVLTVPDWSDALTPTSPGIPFPLTATSNTMLSRTWTDLPSEGIYVSTTPPMGQNSVREIEQVTS